MKKRGFTLIELLAVIVVLAVVALIAFPIIAGIIEKTKRSAAYRSVEGYVEAANNAAVLYDIDNNKGINVTEAKHTFTSNVDTDAFSKIKAKGTLPTYSYLDFDINKKVVTEGHFCINGYSVLYSEGTAKASETKYCEEDNAGSGSNSGNGNGGSTPISSTVLTYNPETDFFGAVNPNTGEWKDLVYAGFNKNDILYSAFSNSAYTRLNSNKASFSITDLEVSLIENGSLAAGSTSTVIFTTPIYINDNTKITLKSQLWKNGPNENGFAQIFISPHKSFPNGVPRTPNVWIASPDILVLKNNYNDASNQWVEYNLDGVNLKNMLSGKFSDFTIPYYIGIDVSNNYANSRGGIKITKLYTD